MKAQIRSLLLFAQEPLCKTGCSSSGKSERVFGEVFHWSLLLVWYGPSMISHAPKWRTYSPQPQELNHRRLVSFHRLVSFAVSRHLAVSLDHRVRHGEAGHPGQPWMTRTARSDRTAQLVSQAWLIRPTAWSAEMRQSGTSTTVAAAASRVRRSFDELWTGRTRSKSPSSASLPGAVILMWRLENVVSIVGFR